MLFILIDQNYGADARIFVDFFGQKAATGASPIAFAWRTGAGVVPIFSVRTAQDKIRIVVDPELDIERNHKTQDVMAQQVQVLTGVVERYVVRYPELWSWVHDRWKSKQTSMERSFES